MIKLLAINFFLFLSLISCGQKKDNNIMTTTKNNQQDIYNIYKTVKHYNREVHYGVIISTANCNFEILINGKKMVFYHDVEVGQVANGLYAPINPAIFNSGEQNISIKLYPGLDKKTKIPNATLGNSQLNIEIVTNILKDGKSIEENTIFTWKTPLEPKENRKNNIPWFNHPETPYYEHNTVFEAEEVPYTVKSYKNSELLITKDNDSLKKLTEEVLLFYNEMKTIFQKKDKNKLAEKVYEKEKIVAQQLYLSREGVRDRWDNDYLINFDSQKRENFIMELIENYKLVFYGNGRLVTLERFDQKYRGESALMSSYKEDGEEEKSIIAITKCFYIAQNEMLN